MRLYLAPHHDDLLLSLPVRLRDEARVSSPHLVVLFSEESDALAAVCDHLHRRLNATVHTLGLLEAGRRGVGMRSCLRRWRKAGDLDGILLADLHDRLATLLRALAPEEVVAPATPVHVDHALTRAAAERCIRDRTSARILYYADRPYASLWPETQDLGDGSWSTPAGCVASPREEVVDLVAPLVPFVSETDVRRILAGYGDGPTCPAEPLWVPAATSTSPARPGSLAGGEIETAHAGSGGDGTFESAAIP